MVVDRYTKMVLTVIAVALAVLAGTQVVSLFTPGTAIAAGHPGGAAPIQRVAICNDKGEFCAMVDETGRMYVK